jgi:outer membrane receptor protein involved in Fe transport
MDLANEQSSFRSWCSSVSRVLGPQFSASCVILLCLSNGCILVFTTSQAEVSAQSQPAPSEADTYTLTQIVITARKREESIQSIPETVVAISSQILSLVGWGRRPCC